VCIFCSAVPTGGAEAFGLTAATSSQALLDARGEKLDSARLWRNELPSSLSGY
jgi:hypothetical protein